MLADYLNIVAAFDNCTTAEQLRACLRPGGVAHQSFMRLKVDPQAAQAVAWVGEQYAQHLGEKARKTAPVK